MVTQAVGGGTSAVAASSHAACQRFRGTDPLITGVSRRTLATNLGLQGQFGSITAARWARAMTFERMVRDESNASQIVTTTVGALGLPRPSGVAIIDARLSTERTAELLAHAHARAATEGIATLIFQLSVPFVGFEGEAATEVKPDFVIVAPDPTRPSASWLIPGDVKDYERVRSRIDDDRLLKGFLQVAVAAESLTTWSQMPEGMTVHAYGVLAVPRNSFLQPEARVELLDDHRAEVRMRINERREEALSATFDPQADLADYVSHLRATFSPSECRTCTLFSYCRNELRSSPELNDRLIELGIPEVYRSDLIWVTDSDANINVPASLKSRVRATLTGQAQGTGQRRVDSIGLAGTINVALAKSDSTTLGVYGITLQRISHAGSGPWNTLVFDAPQSDEARRAIVGAIGSELIAAMKDQRQVTASANGEPDPVHLVVPDAKTADVLTSIADHLAGAELSRLRWDTDKHMGRPALTFNGEPAQVPRALSEQERVGVSFLLEEDRARAFTMRSPIIIIQKVLSQLLTTGGPATDDLRLDYLVEWTQPANDDPTRYTRLADQIEHEFHTPGALLTPACANEIHEAFVGTRRSDQRPADPTLYDRLIRDELAYKADVIGRSVEWIGELPMSRLASAYRAIEGDAQAVWRRRLSLHASDLVRFGRVARWWRNALVETVEADDLCRTQLSVLTNPTYAVDLAANAGTREVAIARVINTEPLLLEIDSRNFDGNSRVVLMHVNGHPSVEKAGVGVTLLKGSVKITDLSIGPLKVTANSKQWLWSPDVVPELSVGDELVVADFSWFSKNKTHQALNVKRPRPDETSSPKPSCSHESFEADPVTHKYCCRPHEDIEAEWSNTLADRRIRGELNPETWPPIVDTDAFEVVGANANVQDPNSEPAMDPPAALTADDLD